MFKTTLQTLEQFKVVLLQITENDFSTPCSVLSDTSIGQHTRHVIELFQCLIKGYDHGMVNYDDRKRDKRIEQERDFAVLKINEIQNSIEKEDKLMMLEQCFDQEKNVITSNYYREVIYNLEKDLRYSFSKEIKEIKIQATLNLPDDFKRNCKNTWTGIAKSNWAEIEIN